MAVRVTRLGVAGAADAGAAEALRGGLRTLLQRCRGNIALVHFIHSLVVRGGRACGSSLGVQELHRTLGVSLLSGVQALEELLPDPPGGGMDPTGAAFGEIGRHRTLLSAIYGACAELGEQPSMDAAVGQLEAALGTARVVRLSWRVARPVAILAQDGFIFYRHSAPIRGVRATLRQHALPRQ